ncbi:hypothetical protein INR49_001339, partial [Caranx melampygus]
MRHGGGTAGEGQLMSTCSLCSMCGLRREKHGAVRVMRCDGVVGGGRWKERRRSKRSGWVAEGAVVKRKRKEEEEEEEEEEQEEEEEGEGEK